MFASFFEKLGVCTMSSYLGITYEELIDMYIDNHSFYKNFNDYAVICNIYGDFLKIALENVFPHYDFYCSRALTRDVIVSFQNKVQLHIHFYQSNVADSITGNKLFLTKNGLAYQDIGMGYNYIKIVSSFSEVIREVEMLFIRNQ